MCMAIGFELREVAGVEALKPIEANIDISHWVMLSTIMLAMFLGLAKRRQEIALLSDDASRHRKILADYSLAYIDQMTSILAASAIITYSFYTVSPETIAKFGNDYLVFSVPMVLYGMLRYLFLIHIQPKGDNPAEVLLRDRPLQINLILWAATIFVVIHLPKTGLI